MFYINLYILSSIYLIYQCFQPGQTTNQNVAHSLLIYIWYTTDWIPHAQVSKFPVYGDWFDKILLWEIQENFPTAQHHRHYRTNNRLCSGVALGDKHKERVN